MTDSCAPSSVLKFLIPLRADAIAMVYLSFASSHDEGSLFKFGPA